MYVSYVKSLFSVFQASQRPETRFYLFVKKSLKAVHFNIKVQTGVLSWVLVFFVFLKYYFSLKRQTIASLLCLAVAWMLFSFTEIELAAPSEVSGVLRNTCCV